MKPCRLCGLNTELCHSHIIPEFFYKPIYDENHRAFHVTSVPDEPNVTLQKGLREYLLCEACEKLFNRWETPAASLYRSAHLATRNARPGAKVVVPCDYATTKLLQLSILWRSSVASRRGFEAVSLGPHEPTIRDHLLRSDPGGPNFYGCLTVSVQGHHELQSIVRLPSRRRHAGHVAYVYHLGGLVWCFLVTSHLPSGQHDFLNRDGLVILVSDRTERDILATYARRIPPAKL